MNLFLLGFFLRVGLAWIGLLLLLFFFKGWCGLDWVGLNLFLLGFFLRVGLAWIGLCCFFCFLRVGVAWIGLV